jgi:hypothetical protein
MLAQRSKRLSTLLGALPTFLTAFFTVEADRAVVFDSSYFCPPATRA